MPAVPNGSSLPLCMGRDPSSARECNYRVTCGLGVPAIGHPQHRGPRPDLGVATDGTTGPGNGPAHEAVAVALWQTAPRPSGFRELWCQDLHSLGDLAKLRARLRSTLTGRAKVADPLLEHWSERL